MKVLWSVLGVVTTGIAQRFAFLSRVHRIIKILKSPEIINVILFGRPDLGNSGDVDGVTEYRMHEQ